MQRIGLMRCKLAVAVLLIALGLLSSVRAAGESEQVLRIDVRFKSGMPLNDPGHLLPATLRASIVRVAPLVNPEAAGRLNAERMARWFRLDLVPNVQIDDFVSALAALDVIEVVEPVAESAPDPDL